MIKLPVIQKESPQNILDDEIFDRYIGEDLFSILSLPFDLEKYEKIIQILNTISYKYNPCNINSEGKCRDRVLHARKNHNTCCTSCELLTSEGCRTYSLPCMFYYCDTASDYLPESVKITVLQIQDFLRENINFSLARNPYFYRHEGIVKNLLGLTS